MPGWTGHSGEPARLLSPATRTERTNLSENILTLRGASCGTLGRTSSLHKVQALEALKLFALRGCFYCLHPTPRRGNAFSWICVGLVMTVIG